MIGIIFYSMLFGWATPTEAGALGALCVFVIALANKMKWPELRGALLETARLTAVIFTVVWGVLIFVRFLGFAGLPEELARWVTELKVAADLRSCSAIYVIYLILGTILEGVGMFLLTLPVVFPVIEALGYDPIWFGIILVKLNGIATLLAAGRAGGVRGQRRAASTSRSPTSSAASGRSSSPTSSPSPA